MKTLQAKLTIAALLAVPFTFAVVKLVALLAALNTLLS